MFTANEKISGRQLYRAIVLTLAGPTLLVCPRVAGQFGADGFLVYGVAGVLSIIYIWLILWLRERCGGSLFGGVKVGKHPGLCVVAKSAINVLLVVKLLLLAVGGLYLICDVVTGILLPETHIFMVLLVVALALIYWNQGSIECTARAFEMLFYWVIVPVIIVVALAAPKVSVSNLPPTFNHDMRDIFWAGVFFWFIFTPAELLILCGDHYRRDKKTVRGVWRGVVVLFVGNLVTYGTILGIYGAGNITEGSPYPLLKVMQISGIPGDFLRRVDGFMSVFLVLSLFCGMVMLLDYMGISLWEICHMLYGDRPKRRKACKNIIDLRKRCASRERANRKLANQEMAGKVSGKKSSGVHSGDRFSMVCCMRNVFRWLCTHKKLIFSTVVVLIMVISVGIIRDKGWFRQPATGQSAVYSDKKMVSSIELEERGFVMSVIIGDETVTFEIASDEKEMWQQQSIYATLHCDTVEEAEILYKESGDKRLDFGHIKMICIEESVVDKPVTAKNLEYMYIQEKYAENVLVCELEGDLAKMSKDAIEKGEAFAVKLENIMVNSGRSEEMELYRVYGKMIGE
ncbi:MAG: GerAB/ArcD/ProY family transporter [Lachnospiraceae bacterium]|nr:GerAB/ArcD/ProY family transporter [Lachnospiraceae bacterium]